MKIGSAPGGQIEGSHGPDVSAYLDFDSVEVEIDGVGWSIGASSTAAMLFISHLGNVLSHGIGASRTPTEIQTRIKALLRGEIIKEEDLEDRLEEVLR
jgi:hypothetical protein